MRFSSLFRGRTKKTAVQPFQAEAESEPSSPKHHSSDECSDVVVERPATTNEETRPGCSPIKPLSATDPFGMAGLSSAQIGASALRCEANSSEDVFPSSATLMEPCRNPLASPSRNPHLAEATPVPPEVPAELERQAISEPEFSVAAPLCEVHDRVAEGYGQQTASSYVSSKWDKRVQALKAMGAVLKGLELGGSRPSAMKGLRLRDRTACWRTACLVLHHSIRDKVMPVRLVSHDLFQDTFAHSEGVVSETEILSSVRQLLSPIIEMLGDSNLRLHESARACVLFVAKTKNLIGLRAALSILQERLYASKGTSRERTKVHFGVLDTVNYLLGHFPKGGRDKNPDPRACWTQEDIEPFVVAGMDDVLGPRVRSSAVMLAVTLRASFGAAKVEPMIAGLRPAVQAVIREKFSEFDDDDDGSDEGDVCDGKFVAPPADLMAGLVICGSAIKLGGGAGLGSATPLSRGSTPLLPGCTNEDVDEDCLMDEILEETGMVFGKGAAAARARVQFNPQDTLSRPRANALVDYDDVDSLCHFDLNGMLIDINDCQGLALCKDEDTPLRPTVRFNMAIEVF